MQVVASISLSWPLSSLARNGLVRSFFLSHWPLLLSHAASSSHRTPVCCWPLFQYGITRKECDEYALRSQKLWGTGHADGAFAKEIAPVEVKTKKGPKVSNTAKITDSHLMV